MITPIRFILDVLYGNLYKMSDDGGGVIPVIKRSYPLDKTPCITLDDSGGSNTLTKHFTNIPLPLPETHPQKEDYPESMPQQVLVDKRQSTVQINVWCDTENEREHINNQIMDLFYKAQTDHYRFCKQYNNQECNTLQDTCKAINAIDKRGVKNQCPKPEEYKYCNLFHYHHIIRPTFNIENPFALDDLSTERITLRSIFKVTMVYYDYYTLGGDIINDLIISDTL